MTETMNTGRHPMRYWVEKEQFNIPQVQSMGNLVGSAPSILLLIMNNVIILNVAHGAVRLT